MKRITLISIFMMTIIHAYGQHKSDSIEVKKSLGTTFRQNGQILTPRQLLEITQSNPEAYKEMKIAKTNNDVGTVFGFAGGFLVGWPLGTAMAGGEPNWALAGIGAGLIVIGIPFSRAYVKHAKNAVRLYNNGLKPTALNHVDFRVGLTYNGMAVKLTF